MVTQIWRRVCVYKYCINNSANVIKLGSKKAKK